MQKGKNEMTTEEKEVAHMAVSMAVVPLLKDETAKSFMETMKCSKLQPYSESQRQKTDKEIEKILRKRGKK